MLMRQLSEEMLNAWLIVARNKDPQLNLPALRF